MSSPEDLGMALHSAAVRGNKRALNKILKTGKHVLVFLRLSARLFVLLGLIGGVMSHLDFQYISIVAWSYICVYRPVFPGWRCKTLKSAW